MIFLFTPNKRKFLKTFNNEVAVQYSKRIKLDWAVLGLLHDVVQENEVSRRFMNKDQKLDRIRV